MARPTLSVLGLYTYDNTLFNNLSVPTGVDKDTVVDNILLECAELEVIYPALPFMKIAIGKWSAKELPIWNKLYATTQFVYNPIYNKDAYYQSTLTDTYDKTVERTPDLTDEQTNDLTNQLTNDLSSVRTPDLTDELTNDLGGTKTTTNTVSAYDATTFVNRDKVEEGTTDTGTATNTHTGTESIADTGTATTTNTGTVTATHTGTDTTTDTGTITHEDYRREYGNIGVTTTQKMIQEERDIDQFNIIDVIVNSFKQRFCILVY